MLEIKDPLPESLVHCLEREILSGADRMVPVNLLVYGKLVFVFQYIATEVVHQAGKGGNLLPAGMCLLEVPDQANADSMQVDFPLADMPTLELFFPSWANFNFSISGINTVSNNKVVGQPVAHPAPAVVAVVYLGISVLCRTVMTNDIGPATPVHPDSGKQFVQVLASQCGYGDLQGLANPDQVRFEPVLPLDRGNGNTIPDRKSAQGISLADNMNGVSGRPKRRETGWQQQPGRSD